MDDTDTTVAELRRDVREFLDEEIRQGTFTPQLDSWITGFSREFSIRLAERGWVGMTIPRAYGGPGRTLLERHVVAEECLAAGAPVTSHWTAERQVAPMIMRLGTEEQRRRLLPRIAAGILSFGVGLSEPEAGSDLASLRTRAHRTDGGWVITGQKVWTTSAHLVEHTIVLCRTDEGHDRHDGLSQLMVDMSSPRVDVRPITTMGGGREFCEVFLDEVFVPDADVIGVIGDGWRQATQELGWERMGPDRYLSTFPLLREFATRATAADDETVGEIMTRLWSLRALSAEVVAKGQSGVEFGADAALAKDAGTVFEQDSVAMVRRMVDLDDDLDPQFRSLVAAAQYAAPTFTLRGGTNEILRGITARGLVNR